jgi:hypothetical protein
MTKITKKSFGRDGDHIRDGFDAAAKIGDGVGVPYLVEQGPRGHGALRADVSLSVGQPLVTRSRFWSKRQERLLRRRFQREGLNLS